MRGAHRYNSQRSTNRELPLKHFDWSQVPQENLNEKLSRKFVNGEKVMVAQLFLKQGCLIPEHSHESEDRKSTRLNSSHLVISYAVFCLKKKKIRQSEYVS